MSEETAGNLSDTELREQMQAGFELLAGQVRIIAMLPLETWLTALNRAESIGAIVDPTLFREYLWSDKAKFIKRLIEVCLPIKRLVLEAQPMIAKEVERDGR